jgi:hypothetical protein
MAADQLQRRWPEKQSAARLQQKQRHKKGDRE